MMVFYCNICLQFLHFFSILSSVDEDFTLRHCLLCLSSFFLSISFRNIFIEQFRALALVHFVDVLQFVYRNKTFIIAVNYFDVIGEFCLKAIAYKFKVISFDHNGQVLLKLCQVFNGWRQFCVGKPISSQHFLQFNKSIKNRYRENQ